MTFAHLANPKPRTATEAYDQWFEGLPEQERAYVAVALSSNMTNTDLRLALEADEDNPAPKYGKDAFSIWRKKVRA